MNRKKNLLIYVLALLMSMVFSTAAFAGETDQTLEFGKKVSGELTAEKANQRYVVTIDEAGLLTVDFSSFINSSVNIQLQDDNGATVFSNNLYSGQPTNAEKWTYSEYLEPGIYHLSVNKKYDYIGNYELQVDFKGIKNTEAEPNNGTAQANDIVFNNNYVGQISWNDSNDTYKVTIQNPGLLTVDFSSYIAGGVNIQLEDSNGTKVYSNKLYNGQPTNAEKWIPSEYLEPGIYFLSINQSYDYTGKYELTMDFEETNNTDAEPNNGTVQANDIIFNQNVVGLISWNDPNDTYKVTIQKPGLLTVDFSSYIAEGVKMQLEDSNGAIVYSNKLYNGQPTNPEKNINSEYLEPGTYYISINRSYDYTGKYEIKVNFEETNNIETEPNNGTAQAQTIKLNDKLTGLISWNDELDTYEVVMQESAYLDLYFSSYIKNGVIISLVNEAGEELIREKLYNGTSTTPEKWAKTINLDAGKYYIHVIKSYEYTGKYSLSVNIKSGWVQESGKWYYFANGTKKTGWVRSGSQWYYLATDGEMKTGWVKSGSAWYYMNSSGAMSTGWVKSGSDWYYMHSSGAMLTGWVKSGSTWYFMNGSGAMSTGWVKSGNTWYFMNNSGAMHSGWKEISGKWYYFYGNGSMAKSVTIGGYKLGSDGAWKN